LFFNAFLYNNIKIGEKMKQEKVNMQFKYHEANKVKNIANSDLSLISKKLNSDIGIPSKQRKNQVAKFGTNKISVKKFNHFKKFFSAIIEPFNLLL